MRRIGRDKNPLLVVDDLFANPDEIRGFATQLRLARPRVGRGYYPGYVADCALPGVDALVAWVAREMWCNGFGLDLETSDLDKVETFDPFFAACTPDPSAAYTGVHVDGHSWLAIVIYLSPHLEAQTGTAFWRHKPSRLESFYNGDDPLRNIVLIDGVFGTNMLRQIPEPLAYSGAATFTEWRTALMEPKVRSPPFPAENHDAWQRTARVPARYNRLVAYPTWLWHSVFMTEYQPPPQIEDARLTLNLFVQHPLLQGAPTRFMPAARVGGIAR